jgi:hypothetical protein
LDHQLVGFQEHPVADDLEVLDLGRLEHALHQRAARDVDRLVRRGREDRRAVRRDVQARAVDDDVRAGRRRRDRLARQDVQIAQAVAVELHRKVLRPVEGEVDHAALHRGLDGVAPGRTSTR